MPFKDLLNIKNKFEIRMYPHLIYVFVCIPTGDIYIGMSANPNLRRNQHIRDLSYKQHSNKYFQELFNTYGLNSLGWYLYKQCKNYEEAQALEQRLISKYGTINNIHAKESKRK